ncbi:CYFA0S15e02432g1_1 [Cyberlindnera fabianii]|uniref:diacetyl reductase [(S)-acetoin forming] n=1 Tax=Cyberlindnera fabianii TaxID=36022 RepID=A0A061B489_CYBFA|nr:L-2,3-butanediol dehydrogenase [Cyberlindnera fabianii]CDR44755.1 CYFA0S15e02432g1_1 [Cyberlindnera fabianii]
MTLKTALVTGASRGIGRAIALQLAHDGYQVAITDLASQKNDALKTVEEIQKLGTKSLFIEADSNIRYQVFAAVDKTHKELGGFDTLVNNAGVMQVKPLIECDEQDLKTIYATNVGGTLWGIQAAATKFDELGHGGKIINASSVAAHNAFPMLSMYSASKWAIRGLTQAAAKELASRQITVNAYCPGCVLTPMMDYVDSKMSEYTGSAKGSTIQGNIDTIALGRGSEPQDVANLVSFLASEKADYITGQSIVVDGGLVFT